MPNETITAEEQVTSTENQETREEETLETASEELAQPESLEIPKKFLGKSPQDILRAYNDLEKQFSKVSSERAEDRKSKEALEARMRELEQRAALAPQSPQQTRQEEEIDPLADYDQQFEADPKTAIKNVVVKTRQLAERTAAKIQQDLEAKNAAQYFQENIVKDQDFTRLQPKMRELAQEYGDLVRDDRANSVKALKLLQLAAKGASLEAYVSDAINKAKKESKTIRQEKKESFSESSRSAADDKVEFGSLTLEQMEKVLGRADD